MNNILDWEERDPGDFAHEQLVQMVFEKVHRYRVDKRLQGLDIVLKIATHDPSPFYKELYEFWGKETILTVNVPAKYANEVMMLLKLLRYEFLFDTDVINGYQDAMGVRFRKLLLVPDDDNPGEILSYLHSMNELGDGKYLRVPTHDGISFALTHKNIPIYTSVKLFMNDHLRVAKRERAKLEEEFGFSSSMTWSDKVKTAISRDINPTEFERYSTRDHLLLELSEEDMEELKELAVALEKYEWTQFLAEE